MRQETGAAVVEQGEERTCGRAWPPVGTADDRYPPQRSRHADAAHLEAFLASGRRRIDAWYAPLRVVEVAFDDEAAFRNINTAEELERWAREPDPAMPDPTQAAAQDPHR